VLPSKCPSLNNFLPWTNVLPVFGVEIHGSALPAIVLCPLCQHQSLAVYKEPGRPGQWYHCTNCHFAGDAVELTAAVSEISIGSAILKLAARGLPIPAELLRPDAIDHYENKIAYRKRIMAFWNTACASTDNSGNTGPAQRKLGITPGAMNAPEWRRRGGRFIGHCLVVDVESLLRPGPMNYRIRTGKHITRNIGWRPLFLGHGWRDLLVVAYNDVPGRISGLMLIGREARWPEDFVFATTQMAGRPWTVGVAMLDAALPHTREFGATVMVLEDPTLATRIQLRHLATNDKPLPVVGAWGRSEDRSIWPCMPRGRDLVHWSAEPNGRLIDRARKSGGRVALAPTLPAILGHLERARPIIALRSMQAAARPWDAALETLLGRLSPAKAEELVLGLKLRSDEITGFLRACADDTRVRLAALFGDAGKPRGVTISGKTVTESGGAWRVAKSGELVCDAVLRIDQVIRSVSGRVSYRGRIEYKGQTLAFWAPDSEIERDTLRWIRTKVGQAGLGEVVIGSIFWSKHIMAIAQQFEPPESVRGLDVVGWDEARNAFTMPQFVLQGNGEVVSPDYMVPPEAVVPGAGLVPPDGMTPGARVAMAWNDEANELFWAAATCLLTDILAPALGFPRTSTALVGAGAVGVGTATALAFGCITARVPDHSRITMPAAVRRLLDMHHWPLLVRRSAEDDSHVLSRVLSQLQGGVIAAAADWAADVLAMTGNWHVIVGPHLMPTDRATEHGGTVVVNYLKDLCDRRLNLEVRGSLLDAVHADLADWYGRVTSSRSVQSARRHIYAADPTTHPDRFGRLVCRMIACGELRLAKPGTGRKQIITLLGGDRVHIPKWSFNDVLMRRRAFPLDASLVSTQLRAAGILLEERDQDCVAGWVISERWLRQYMTDHQKEVGPTSVS
jgi:hypothetical protein